MDTVKRYSHEDVSESIKKVEDSMIELAKNFDQLRITLEKIWNNICIYLSNTLDTFMIFEAELCGLVGERYDMAMAETSVIYSIKKG